MGKAKTKDKETFSFVVDLKTALSLAPQQRVRWVGKACRKVADGEASIKHLYDVLSSRKLVSEMPEKVGRRMLRVVRENLYLFSVKQQRFLTEESALAMNFTLDDRSEDEAEEPEVAAAPSSRSDDAAARMEEMMIRCRDFVRQKASTFEHRRIEAEEAERQAAIAREKEAAERFAREWEEIRKWHSRLEEWEQANMVANDGRYQVHLQVCRRMRSRSCHSSDSSRGGESDDERRHKKDKDNNKDKRRRRDRGRRRNRSSSRDSHTRDKDAPAQPPARRHRVDETRVPNATLADLLRGNPA